MLPAFLYQAAFIGVGLCVLYLTLRRVRRQSIAYLPGPKSTSWLVGNVPDFQRPVNACDADFSWSDRYGLAFRTKGCFGEDLLYLADPKALQHVLNKRGYNYPSSYEVRNLQQLLTGRGILWAAGEQHARHRKIMNPAFSYPALKGFLPLFFEIAEKTTAIWTTVLHEREQPTFVVDVSSWLARTTLDIIGAAAFGYDFKALEGEETELSKAYHNLFVDSSYMISNPTIVFRRLTGFVPLWLTKYLFILPTKDIQRMRRCDTLIKDIGKELLAQQCEVHALGREGGKDVMSILIKANMSEDPKRRLGTDEVLAQIMTLTLAGHETTATTLSWILYELSRHPDIQNRLRDEIKVMRRKVVARGDKKMSIADLESMGLAAAVMRESLRLYPIVPHISRVVGRDDVIPLEQPQRSLSAETITSIPVSRGQIVTISLIVYNRLKSVWGEDADQWRPDRFLHESSNEHDRKITLGVFGNLATFSSGVRSCIGWRFSLLEMQAILIELIENFEFSPAPENVEIKRAMAVLMEPMVKGEESKGMQMPLAVTAIKEL